MPWNWLVALITAYIYELSKELRIFVTECSGACLSLLHCLEALLYSPFHFITRSLGLLLGILCASSAFPSPQIPRRASRWRCSLRSCPRPVCSLSCPKGGSHRPLPSSLGLFLVSAAQEWAADTMKYIPSAPREYILSAPIKIRKGMRETRRDAHLILLLWQPLGLLLQ